jgi:TIR domain
MSTIFLSYSHKDYFFAELLGFKLSEAAMTLWRDHGSLPAGADWRQGIEKGIAESFAVVVVLSEASSRSPYVTFEWAYALGRGKAVIPVRLDACASHPRLETIQHLDFSPGRTLPWALLIERIREIEADAEDGDASSTASAVESEPQPNDTYAKAILAYLNQQGAQKASFVKLRGVISNTLTDQEFNDIILRNPTVFRHARIKKVGPGIAKLIP